MATSLERVLKVGCLLILLLSLQGCALLLSWRELPPVWSEGSYQQAVAPQNRRGPNVSYAKRLRSNPNVPCPLANWKTTEALQVGITPSACQSCLSQGAAFP
jgi:hypothetical protein